MSDLVGNPEDRFSRVAAHLQPDHCFFNYKNFKRHVFDAETEVKKKTKNKLTYLFNN